MHSSFQKRIFQFAATLILIVASYEATAEMRRITATGEYQMAANDTMADAVRLVRQEAEWLALEKAGTYLEGVAEIQQSQLKQDEIRAYVPGVFDMVASEVRTLKVDQVVILQTDVAITVDTNDFLRRINGLGDAVRAELVRLREQREKLRQNLEAKTKEIATLSSKLEAETEAEKRRRVLGKLEADSLVRRGIYALTAGRGYSNHPGSTFRGRTDARAFAEQAIALDPENTGGHILIGNILFEDDDLGGAVRSFQTAVRLDPNSSGAHGNLGMVLKAQGDLAGALSELREAVRLNPLDVGAHLNLGRALLEAEDIEGALTEQREVASLNPNHPGNHFNVNAYTHNKLGLQLGRAGDHGGAVAEFQESIRFKPMAFVYYNLGREYMTLGQVDLAKNAFEGALKLKPPFPRAHIQIGQILEQRGNLDEALVEYRKAVQLLPNYPDAHINLGKALQAKGNLPDATEEYEETLRLLPNHAWAHYGMGSILFKKNDAGGAIAHFREARRLEPTNVAWASWLGQALLKKGDYDGAISEYQAARDLQPGNAQVHLLLGMAHWSKGRLAEASGELQEYLRLAPKTSSEEKSIQKAKKTLRDAERLMRRYGPVIRPGGCSTTAHAVDLAGLADAHGMDVDGCFLALLGILVLRVHFKSDKLV